MLFPVHVVCMGKKLQINVGKTGCSSECWLPKAWTNYFSRYKRMNHSLGFVSSIVVVLVFSDKITGTTPGYSDGQLASCVLKNWLGMYWLLYNIRSDTVVLYKIFKFVNLIIWFLHSLIGNRHVCSPWASTPLFSPGSWEKFWQYLSPAYQWQMWVICCIPAWSYCLEAPCILYQGK